MAAQMGFLPILKLLFTPSTIHQMRKSDGLSLLQIAAAMGQQNIVEYLCEQGVDLDHMSTDGKTALKHAEEARHSSIVKYIVQKKSEKHPWVEKEEKKDRL